jgi:hypothetical protein
MRILTFLIYADRFYKLHQRAGAQEYEYEGETWLQKITHLTRLRKVPPIK